MISIHQIIISWLLTEIKSKLVVYLRVFKFMRCDLLRTNLFPRSFSECCCPPLGRAVTQLCWTPPRVRVEMARGWTTVGAGSAVK